MNPSSHDARPPLSPALLRVLTSDAVRRKTLRHLRGAHDLQLPAADAEDAFQSALEQALVSPPAGENESSLAGWLRTVARNKAFDLLRRAARRGVEPGLRVEELPAPAPPDGPGSVERWARGSIPGAHGQDTIDCLLARADGASIEELAAERRIRPGALRARMAAAREALRARRGELRRAASARPAGEQGDGHGVPSVPPALLATGLPVPRRGEKEKEGEAIFFSEPPNKRGGSKRCTGERRKGARGASPARLSITPDPPPREEDDM